MKGRVYYIESDRREDRPAHDVVRRRPIPT